MPKLLAIGLLLTTATQFRLGDRLPLGPGELCLIAWIGLTLLRELTRHGPGATPVFSRMLIFWGLFAVAEFIGAVTGFVIGYPNNHGLLVHDIVAFTLMSAFACMCVAGPRSEVGLQQAARILLALGAFALLPQLGVGWRLIEVPFLDPWFGNRFRGWSANPNQLAFLCAVLVLLALHFADQAKSGMDRVVTVLYAVPPLCIGRLTKTDTFTFSLIAAAGLYLVIKLRFWATLPATQKSVRPQLALLVALAAPLILVSAAPVIVPYLGDVPSLTQGLMKDGGKEAKRETDLRLQLWHEAIERGVDSAMLGLGPGPHLPIPPSIIEARASESGLDTGNPPPADGIPDFEAHNTPLDLFAQGGLVATLDFLWIMAAAFMACYRARLAGLTALACGLMVFALEDFLVREPIFWFGAALCLALGFAEREPEHGNMAGRAPNDAYRPIAGRVSG